MSSRDARRLSLFLLLTPFTLWIGLLIVLPHITILLLSLREKVRPRVFTYGLGNYIAFLGEPLYWHTLLRTAVMSLLVTALALVIAFPIAYYITKVAATRWRGGLLLLCLVPL